MADDAGIMQIFSTAQEELVLQSSDLSLRTVTSMVESGAIDIKPQFQRRDRWTVKKQAALIESFVLNIPVPPIYLAEDELGTYSVIDGKQRITAISSYLTNGFELRFLERFPELEGKAFGRLPRPIQNALDFRPLRTITLRIYSGPSRSKASGGQRSSPVTKRPTGWSRRTMTLWP